MKLYLFLTCQFLFFNTVSAKALETLYGSIEVEEQIIWDLINTKSFQRLKNIHQYGVSYYCTEFNEDMNRYDHSIGVFAILRKAERPLNEQIAGLLHDVSHTAFSHVGDWIYQKQNQEKDYQNSIHYEFLKQSDLGEVLKNHGVDIETILPEEDLCPALESKLPNLCADRIDYNIQGAFYRGFLTHQEVKMLFDSLHYDGLDWICVEDEIIKKVSLFSLYMTQNCWGGAENDLISTWLADALLRACEIGIISFDDLQNAEDDYLWNKLIIQEDEIIKKNMFRLSDPKKFYSISNDKSGKFVKSKFRGIDPWILKSGEKFRLSSLDEQFFNLFYQTKISMENGQYVLVND